MGWIMGTVGLGILLIAGFIGFTVRAFRIAGSYQTD